MKLSRPPCTVSTPVPESVYVPFPSWFNPRYKPSSDEDELTKGGTGYGVRLLTRWLEVLSAARRKAA